MTRKPVVNNSDGTILDVSKDKVQTAIDLGALYWPRGKCFVAPAGTDLWPFCDAGLILDDHEELGLVEEEADPSAAGKEI